MNITIYSVTPKLENATMKQIEDEKKSGQFGKDFMVGCGSLILLAIVIFVVVPVLFFILKIGAFFAILIGFIMAIIILTACWGRLINFLRKKW